MLDADPRPEKISQVTGFGEPNGPYTSVDMLVVGIETVTRDRRGRELIPHKEIGFYLGPADDPATPKVTIPAAFAIDLAGRLTEFAEQAKAANNRGN